MINSDYIRGEFFQQLEAYKGESWVDVVSMYIPDCDPTETYEWLGAVPGMKVWSGARDAKEFIENLYAISCVVFESTVDFKRDWLVNDKTGQLQIRIAELVERSAEQWAELLSTLILNGHTGDCYDGKKFFATNHVEGDSGTQKNLVTKTTVPALQVVAPTKPTVSEAIEAILGVITHLRSFKDDRGKPMNTRAKQFIIQVGSGLFPHLVHATIGEIAQGGSSNVINELRKKGYSIEVEQNPSLDEWTDTFTVLRADGIAKPFIRQEVEPVSLSYLGVDSEYCHTYDRCQAGARANRSAGYGLWSHAVKAVLST